MKVVFKFIFSILAILVLDTANVGSYKIQACIVDSELFHPQTNFITNEQTKAQVQLFREALDKFGATSPEQVISIWANAEKSRNGVLHYAVSCNELKNKIIKGWGEPRDSFWIYGGSSPWLEKYEILYNRKLNDTEYEAKIKFFWVSSAGPSKPTETTLLIVKNKDIWCVKEAK
ncbi:hypothetical protein [Candidatus Clostridium stratigraminis]|uniref:Uncharacterized protein n=1 Tax=Candidatus Clostridium stratigraminis TaxID=3381661 RepID=A0ABW8TAK3_9CLOT